MPQQSKRWCFTINNPVPADEERLTTLANGENVTYLVFGRETAATGTPHLQGFVTFAVNCRFRRAKGYIGETAHIEVARGTSLQAANYCKKEGNFEEFGDLPGRNQGRRTDIDEFKDWVLGQATKPSARLVAENFPGLYLKYGRVMELVDALYPELPLRQGVPRAWQADLAQELAGDADDRTVVFIVDPIGGRGKSWFIQWYYTNDRTNTQILRIGKRDDLAHAVDDSKSVFLIDIPRSESEFLQYSILEQLKDRLVFSPKYSSRMKVLTKTPHVVVFMNENPDLNKLSTDRYDVREISQRIPDLYLN